MLAPSRALTVGIGWFLLWYCTAVSSGSSAAVMADALSTSASPFGNQMVNYISMAIILWNLNAYAPKPLFTLRWARGLEGDFSTPLYYIISLLNYAVVYVALPIAVLYLIIRLYRRIYWHYKGGGDENYVGEDYVGGAGDL